MSSILIAYATSEGHTARVAECVAQVLRERGHRVEARRLGAGDTELGLAGHDGVIVGASIHYGHHPAFLRRLVRRQWMELQSRPGAFFSVSLSAGGPGAKPAAAARYLARFLRQTGWTPQQTASVAGALPYSRFGAFKRMVMIAFVGLAGGDTDTSRDYEYTDWEAVRRFAQDFARRLGSPSA